MFRKPAIHHLFAVAGPKATRLGTCLALCLTTLFPSQKTQGAPALQWTLEQAFDLALARNPNLQAQTWKVEEVASDLVAARIYPFNPRLELEAGNRRSLGTRTTDPGVILTQELEIGGQRSHRVAAAGQQLEAAKARFRRHQLLLLLEVETAFVEALRDRESLTVAETDAQLARDLLDFSKRRLERGAATQMEVNLSQASAGRAERRLQRARASYASSRSRLAEVVGIDPQAQPEPLGELTFPPVELPVELPVKPPVEPPVLAGLLEVARKNRGDLDSLGRREQAAEAATRLALAERHPNLTVGTFLRREEGTDDIVGATLGFSLPLFQRHQGRVAKHRAQQQRLRYEREALDLAIRQEVIEASNDLLAAQGAVEFLRDQVLGTLEENVELLQRSFAAGRIGVTEVVTLRREFVATSLEYIEALADIWLARIALHRATGDLAGRTVLQ